MFQYLGHQYQLTKTRKNPMAKIAIGLINFYLIIVFFLVFSIVSIIPIINILCLLEAFTDQAYQMIYTFISQKTKEEQM